MRAPGDALFALGALVLVAFVFLTPMGKATAEEEAAEVEVLAEV
jgi:hypothetical protein